MVGFVDQAIDNYKSADDQASVEYLEMVKMV